VSITTIITIIVIVLVLSVVGSIIFTKKEQAASERRQKVAGFRFKADEAQDLHDGLTRAGLDKQAYKFLLQRVVDNLQAAMDVDPSTAGLKRRLDDAKQQLADVDSATYYIEMPSGMVELQGLIARLNKLIKYLVLLYQRRMIPESMFQQLMPSLQRTLLKFDAEGHIKMGHQAANEAQIGTAKQSYLHAKKKLLEFGEDDAYVQQQLPIVEELLQQIADREGLEAEIDKPTTEPQKPKFTDPDDARRQEAIASQEELNQRSMDDDFGPKKKW
jgi:hypothetical protein